MAGVAHCRLRKRSLRNSSLRDFCLSSGSENYEEVKVLCFLLLLFWRRGLGFLDSNIQTDCYYNLSSLRYKKINIDTIFIYNFLEKYKDLKQ